MREASAATAERALIDAVLPASAGTIWNESVEIFLASVRDGFVQVSAFVAVTVLLFSLVQYRTDGQLLERLEDAGRAQPLFGALMGLTPGCGGAIVVMPLYVRGSVSFGTVVATLVATAGDSAFIILALAPEAALSAYGIAFAAAVAFGYAIDRWGLGVGRVDRAVARLQPAMTDGGTVAATDGFGSAAGSKVHHYEDAGCDVGASVHQAASDATATGFLARVSETALWAWWVAAAAALVLGVMYLLNGAPEVPLVLGVSYAGAFTAFGVAGTALSFYLYFVGRHHLGHGDVGRARDAFSTVREPLVHAGMETSFVTVWVLAAYLLYEYGVVLLGVDVAAAAMAAGVLAPVAGAVVGLIPGCGPQIVLATAYAEGAIPFSALTANAISQDGDALFPLVAIDPRAALVASIYTTVPALVVGVALHYTWTAVLGFPSFGFGVV